VDALFGVHTLFRFDVFGTSVGLPVGIVVQWSVMVLAFLAVFLMRRNAKPVPKSLQNFSEILTSTLKRWTTRRKVVAGDAKRFHASPEALSAGVMTAFLFILVFWVTEAVTNLPVANGPIAALATWLTPLYLALKEKTILGPILDRFTGQDIGADIRASLNIKEAFGFNLFGTHVMVADIVVVMWGVMLVLFLFALWLGRGFHPIPKGKQLVAENLVNGLQGLLGSVMPKELVDRYVPFVGTFILFIGLNNITSTFRLPPPAKSPAFPIALALLAIGSVFFFSIREVGFRGFGRSMIYPNKAMLPFKIIDFATKIISLSLRLFGNIFGAFVFMEFINIIMPVLLPGLVGLWFDLADGLIQGLVFGYLTALYIGEVVENAHNAQHAA
jgi:F-type H+-transporting ATPase subunit a